eukprot:scaffold7377_cov389-Prasinococcus_capsulatus_cf.AAC.7
MDLLVYQLEWFHRAKEYVRRRAKVNDEILIHNSMEERAQIEDVLVSSSELHPAIRSPENETRILRTLSEGVCALLLNRTEAECSMVRSQHDKWPVPSALSSGYSHRAQAASWEQPMLTPAYVVA